MASRGIHDFAPIGRPVVTETVLHTVTFIAMGAVVLVLVAGVVNMVRGDSGNRSQLLMRWRVILQFTAIVVMMAALYFASS